jgi:hypothetical protein
VFFFFKRNIEALTAMRPKPTIPIIVEVETPSVFGRFVVVAAAVVVEAAPTEIAPRPAIATTPLAGTATEITPLASVVPKEAPDDGSMTFAFAHGADT